MSNPTPTRAIILQLSALSIIAFVIVVGLDNIDQEAAKAKNIRVINAVEGIMMQAETVNRNGRKYPSSILMGECSRYNKELVAEKRSFGVRIPVFPQTVGW